MWKHKDGFETKIKSAHTDKHHFAQSSSKILMGGPGEEAAAPSKHPPSHQTKVLAAAGNKSQQRQYRGVTYEKNTAKWRARLYSRGTHLTLGRFQTAELAASAHDAAAIFVWGEGARTNLGHEHARDFDVVKRCNYQRLLALREETGRSHHTRADDAKLRAARFAAACYALGVPIDRSLSHASNRTARFSGAWKALVLVAVRCPRSV